jgi:hypothetical protein
VNRWNRCPRLPWEQIDTYSGNVILSFEDLTLPGNAGLDLTIHRTTNANDSV